MVSALSLPTKLGMSQHHLLNNVCLPSEEAPLIPVRSGSVSVHSRSFHGSAVYSRAIIALLTSDRSCIVFYYVAGPVSPHHSCFSELSQLFGWFFLISRRLSLSCFL